MDHKAEKRKETGHFPPNSKEPWPVGSLALILSLGADYLSAHFLSDARTVPTVTLT